MAVDLAGRVRTPDGDLTHADTITQGPWHARSCDGTGWDSADNTRAVACPVCRPHVRARRRDQVTRRPPPHGWRRRR
jgi:hypothetical protein